ncbi:MAG: glycerol-3-phosphate 1-O-acyltransferase PlsY [Clostridiales bacterium]|nr:glycerol-3-phosphate 1-O-acyltransferase PlsY [Clostridiales bacterium]
MIGTKIICLALGYVLGLFQTSYIIGKVFNHVDIREQGSGNAGTTNAFRVLGKKAGIMVFIGDFLKLVIAYFLARLIFGEGVFSMYAAVGCVLGHIFPFYMGFKGGKGIACSLALMLCINPVFALVTYIIGFIVFKIWHYVSAASLTMVVVYPLLMALAYLYGQESLIISGNFGIYLGLYGLENIILMLIITVITYYKHRENIARLIHGEENKFSVKKKV